MIFQTKTNPIVKKLTVVLILLVLSFSYTQLVHSANTHATDLESSSSQSWSITDAAQTGLDITGDFTIEFWLKHESLTDSIIFDKGNGTGGYLLAHGDGGLDALVLQYWDGSSNKTEIRVSGFYTGEVGNCVHAAVAVDVSAASAEFYKNAAGQSETVNTGNATSVGATSEDVSIGVANGGSVYVDGVIDDFRIWNDIRTAQEISDNYQKSLAGTEGGLVAGS